MTAATAPVERFRLGYRPSLDGLRGIAIILVVMLHAGVAPATTGVTIFFALSGFLITALLIEERSRTGSVSLLAFYRRRALRLLPAMVVVIGAVALWMFVTGRSGDIASHTLPALTYTSNWFEAFGADLGLLGHTWSLSVEEQFYLLWPAIFLATLAASRGRVGPPLAVLALGIGASFATRVVIWDGTHAALERISYAFDTRADALLLGCALAIVVTRGWNAPRRTGWVALATLGAASISSLGPVWSHGFGAAGAVLSVAVIAGAQRSWVSWAPLVGIGRISYGLYLWHQPIFKEGRLLTEGWPLIPQTLLLIAVALAVAALSYRYVERPFLRLKRPGGEATEAPRLGSETGSRVSTLAPSSAVK